MAKKRQSVHPDQFRDRIKEFRRVKASELQVNPRNWRTHPESQRQAMRGLLAEIGYANAVIARETRGGKLVLIDGHLRQEESPDQLIPTLILDVTAKEADKLLATLDPVGAMAEANRERLAELLPGIQTDCEALEKMLADLGRNSGIENRSGIDDVGPQIDRAAELQKQWGTKPGQLWELVGRSGMVHRLLCGDCRNRSDMARLVDRGNINIAFTSPPYASQRKYDESSGFNPIPPDEYVAWWEPVQANIRTHLAVDGSFFVNIKPNAHGLDTELYVFDLVCEMVRRWGWHFGTEFCWERNGVPKGVSQRFKNQFEPVYQFVVGRWKMRPDAVRHESDSVPIAGGKGVGNTGWGTNRQGAGGDAVLPNDDAPGLAFPGNRLPTFGNTDAMGHHAAFPIGLPSFFIAAFSDEGDLICDPFVGSGTTMIAAEQLGRRCFGMEISPAYCAVVLQRCTDAGMKCRLEAIKTNGEPLRTVRRSKREQAGKEPAHV